MSNTDGSLNGRRRVVITGLGVATPLGNELEVFWKDASPKETQGFTDVLISESYHPFWSNWWPHGHIIGWEHTFVHEIAHLLDAIVNNKEVAPYGATFEDGYRNAVICDAIVQSSLEGRRIAIEY